MSCGACARCGRDRLRPLARHRLVEALELAVRARAVGRRGQVADAAAGEELAQRAVLHVAEGVVGHEPLGRDFPRGEEGERPLDEGGHRRGPLVRMELDVGQARVVVDDRVRVVVADARFRPHPVARALRAVARDGVPGPREARRAGDVHVQEVARAGPLVAVGGLLQRPRRPRDPRPAQHLPDGRVGEAGRGRNEPRSPACRLAAGADALLELGSELARAAARPTRAIDKTGEAHARLSRLAPAVPPAMRGRRRHAEGGRGRLEAHSSLDCLDEGEAAGQSELGITVESHPGPPWA